VVDVLLHYVILLSFTCLAWYAVVYLLQLSGFAEVLGTLHAHGHNIAMAEALVTVRYLVVVDLRENHAVSC